MRADQYHNVGARCVIAVPLSKGSGLIPGSYAIPVRHASRDGGLHQHHADPAYRSSGRPEVPSRSSGSSTLRRPGFGIDRIKLRRKNLIRPEAMPTATAVGMHYDSGRYEENMDWAMDIADWKGSKQRRRAAAKRGKLLGRGLANYVESSIGGAQRAGADHRASRRTRRRRHRHAAERPGP